MNSAAQDVLFTRNQYLRWVLIDEIFMIPDDLFGAFEHQLSRASQSSPFKKHPDGTVRMFGGYNVLTFGDMFQIPPIPDAGALFLPPNAEKIENKRLLQESILDLTTSFCSICQQKAYILEENLVTQKSLYGKVTHPLLMIELSIVETSKSHLIVKVSQKSLYARIILESPYNGVTV